MRGLGYLISIVSVLLLGLLAWPRADEPSWHLPALLAGMVLSVFGMGLRWGSSRQQKNELHHLKRQVGARHPAE